MANTRIRKRTTITNVDAIHRIDAMIEIIVENVQIALSVEAALESANDIVMASIRDSEFYGAGCYNTVKDSLGLNLAITLARLFDPGAKRYHPNKRDVASIPLLIRLLRQRRCRKILATRAREWTPDIPRLEDANAATCERRIDGAISAYTQLRKTHHGRQAVDTLRQFRDRKLAHSLTTAALKALPRYQQLFLLTDIAHDVADHAKLAIQGNNLELKGVEQEFRREAKAFWQPALQAAVSAAGR